MASLTFSAAIMDDIRRAMRQHRPTVANPSHREDQEDHEDHQATPCAEQMFESWVQDLDDQTLPEMDSDELRILHALLFGAGDDAFAVADELLQQTLEA